MPPALSLTPKIGQKLVMNLQMTPGVWVRGRVVNSDERPIAHLEVQGQNDDQLDRMYYNPPLTDANGNFLLGSDESRPIRDLFLRPIGPSHRAKRSRPNSSRCAGRSSPMSATSNRRPRPSPIPPWYKSQYSAAPAPPADKLAAYHNRPSSEAAPQPPTGPQGPNAAEEELVGNPAKPGDLSGKVSDEQGRPLSGVSFTSPISTATPIPAPIPTANSICTAWTCIRKCKFAFPSRLRS